MIKKLFLLGFLVTVMGCLINVDAGAKDSEKIKRLEKRLEKLEKIEKSRYKKGEKEIISYYKNGFKMRTLDDQFKFQVGGRIQHDWGFFSESQTFQSSIGQQENGSRFRRVRFFMAGMLH